MRLADPEVLELAKTLVHDWACNPCSVAVEAKLVNIEGKKILQVGIMPDNILAIRAYITLYFELRHLRRKILESYKSKHDTEDISMGEDILAMVRNTLEHLEDKLYQAEK